MPDNQCCGSVSGILLPKAWQQFFWIQNTEILCQFNVTDPDPGWKIQDPELKMPDPGWKIQTRDPG
jgi:hypothetical protein